MDLGLARYAVAGCSVLAVAGEIDIATVPQLRRALLAATEGNTRTLVLDLLEVGFMDCSGLGVLIGARRRMPDAAVMCIVCDRPEITRIFDITGLHAVFPVHSTVAEAVLLHQEQPSRSTGGRRPPDRSTADRVRDARPWLVEREGLR